MTSTNIDSVIQQLVKTGVPFIGPSDPEWATYSSTYNLRCPITPAIVILPTCVPHISHAVTCAGEHGLKVQARSGGHSYSSYSNGGVNGAMVIDLRKFQHINSDYDPVLVHSGMRLGNLAQGIYDGLGRKRALPHGTCAGVGLGGHLTHGGYGLFSRAWGLAMDHIIALSVVTADGNLVFADDEENQDLFYAMRGAADSFGIVKSFFLETLPAPESVILWDVQISGVAKSVDTAVSAFQHIQNLVHDDTIVDRNLGFNMNLAAGLFQIGGTYLGSRDNLEDIIIPEMLAGVTEVPKIEIEQVDWLKSLKLHNQGRDIATSADYSEHSNFFAKSVVVPEPGLSKEALTSFFTYLFNKGSRAPVSYFILADLYGGADSQINNKDQDFSAFAHRDALWVFQIYGYVDNDRAFPSRGLDFINGVADSITMHLPRYGAYSSYTDPTLTKEQAHKLYYGEEVYDRLKVIKQKWDPNNVFSNPQSI